MQKIKKGVDVSEQIYYFVTILLEYVIEIVTKSQILLLQI